MKHLLDVNLLLAAIWVDYQHKRQKRRVRHLTPTLSPIEAERENVAVTRPLRTLFSVLLRHLTAGYELARRRFPNLLRFLCLFVAIAVVES